MFNTVKKFAHSLKAKISGTNARPQAKRRGNVIALPAKPNIEDGKALLDARRSLANTLEQVILKRREELAEQIIDWLDDGADNAYFDTDALIDALNQLGINRADYFDDDDWHALAAAVNYYDNSLMADLQKAVEVVASGDYRHYRDAYDEATLGAALYGAWIDDVNKYIVKTTLYELPYWLEGAIDFEEVGRVFLADYGGKITRNGYFAPLYD